MISQKHLQEIEATLRAELPDDSGKAQLGLIAIDQLKITRKVLVGAAIPLEVMAGQIRQNPYTELSKDCQRSILQACDDIHHALESHTCNAERPDDTPLTYCDRDDYACEDDGKVREYFDCACGNPNHLFKFSLEPTSGTFALSTHLSTDEHGFFKRLWLGLRYAFGHRSPEGHWDRVVLDRPAAERLHRLTNEALDAMQDAAIKRLQN